jgi:hypothetical protein
MALGSRQEAEGERAPEHDRGGAHRLVKVVPHDPGVTTWKTRIKGWVTHEIFLMGKTPEEMERLLGFDGRPGSEYLPHGIDAYLITRPVQEDEFELRGAYTYLPNGNEWDGVDLRWPPGTGAPQWRLIKDVDCRFLKTVPRGSRY